MLQCTDVKKINNIKNAKKCRDIKQIAAAGHSFVPPPSRNQCLTFLASYIFKKELITIIVIN